MSYTKPQAIIHQRFTVATSPTVTTLRAVIVGPNTKLHRYSVVDEKELTSAGNFGAFAEVEDSYALIDFPDRKAGEIVERDSVKLHIDNALLTYYTDNSGSETLADSTAVLTLSNQPNFYVDDDQPNVVTVGTETINGKERLKVNLVEMAEAMRSAEVKRDVQIGDYVCLTGVTETENSAGCTTTEPFISRIIDFQYALEAKTIGDPTVSVSVDYRVTTPEESSVELTVVPVTDEDARGCMSQIFEIDTSYYFNGWAIGKPTITYIITPEVKSYYNCRNKIKFNVKCNALGIKDTDIWFSRTEGAFLPGSNGTVRITLKEGVTAEQLIAFVDGTDKLRIVCTCAGRELIPEKLGSDTDGSSNKDIVIDGNATTLDVNDTLILKCTKGGVLRETEQDGDDNTIKLTAYTQYGKLISKEFTISALDTPVSIGTSGITIKPRLGATSLGTAATTVIPDIPYTKATDTYTYSQIYKPYAVLGTDTVTYYKPGADTTGESLYTKSGNVYTEVATLVALKDAEGASVPVYTSPATDVYTAVDSYGVIDESNKTYFRDITVINAAGDPLYKKTGDAYDPLGSASFSASEIYYTRNTIESYSRVTVPYLTVTTAGGVTTLKYKAPGKVATDVKTRAIANNTFTYANATTYDNNTEYYIEVVTGSTTTYQKIASCPWISSDGSSVKYHEAGTASSDAGEAVYGGATSTFFALFTGDEIYVPLIATKEVGVSGLALARSVPDALKSSDLAAEIIPLNVKLLSKENVEFVEGEGIEFEPTQIKVDTELDYVSPTLYGTDGNALRMPVQVYEDNIDFNKMYIEYKTWVPTASYGLNFCESVAALDDIPGQLDPENPLKYAVYKALANSNGASVAYVAVKEPYTFSSATEKTPNLESWQDALEILEGRDDVYTVVPTTTEQTVQNLVNTLVQNESSAEACRWKTAVFAVEAPKKRLIVGVKDSFTSTDGNPVVARFEENTSETGAGYNKLRVTSGNSLFLERVQAGDIISMANGYQTYVVDKVITDDTLYTLPTGITAQTAGNAIEIWHTLNRADVVEYVRDYAQSFANRRIGLIWPDTIGEAGVDLPGYMLAAGLAGLKSGVEPIQGLTRLEVAGFDDFSRARPYLTETQMNLMAGSGVWIVQEDSDGTPASRHAINTSTVDINYREEMMTRNMDSICKYLYQIIDRYIGVTIVNQDTLNSIYHALTTACNYLVYIKQMNSYASIRVKQHDLLADRIEAFIVASLPYATNNVELYVTAERAELNEVSTETEQE